MTPTKIAPQSRKEHLDKLRQIANQCRNWHMVCQGIRTQLDTLPMGSQRRIPLIRNLTNSEACLRNYISKGQAQLQFITLGDARAAGLATADGDFWWESSMPRSR